MSAAALMAAYSFVDNVSMDLHEIFTLAASGDGGASLRTAINEALPSAATDMCVGWSTGYRDRSESDLSVYHLIGSVAGFLSCQDGSRRETTEKGSLWSCWELECGEDLEGFIQRTADRLKRML